MRKLSIMIFAFAASLAAQDYSGIWNGTGGIESNKYGSVPQTAQMTLLQSGTALQGTFKLGNGTILTISSGTVSGGQVSFVIGRGSLTATLAATGGQLTGKMTSSSGQVADFVFTKK